LKQEGQDQPLAVFEREFLIGARLALPAALQPGDLVVPLRLRYQACNDKMCFLPTTAEASWTLRVVPSAVPTSAAHADLVARTASGRGAGATAPPRPPASPEPPAPSHQPPATNAVAALDRFTVLATTGGYLSSGEFLQFIHDAEAGVKPRGLFEGR